MLQPVNGAKVTAVCPSGHKLRGNSELVGRPVKCPRCSCEFVFALTLDRAINTNTKKVTDTGVMRILGELSSLPPAPKSRQASERPCNRCGILIPEETAVCSHCNCYVGAMPTFLRQMSTRPPQEN